MAWSRVAEGACTIQPKDSHHCFASSHNIHGSVSFPEALLLYTRGQGARKGQGIYCPPQQKW